MSASKKEERKVIQDGIIFLIVVIALFLWVIVGEKCGCSFPPYDPNDDIPDAKYREWNP